MERDLLSLYITRQMPKIRAGGVGFSAGMLACLHLLLSFVTGILSTEHTRSTVLSKSIGLKEEIFSSITALNSESSLSGVCSAVLQKHFPRLALFTTWRSKLSVCIELSFWPRQPKSASAVLCSAALEIA